MFIVECESLHEGFAETSEEEKRSAEEKHLAFDGASLSKTRNGLVNDSLKDTCSDVLTAGTLIEKRLDVGLSENSAA